LLARHKGLKNKTPKRLGKELKHLLNASIREEDIKALELKGGVVHTCEIMRCDILKEEDNERLY